MDDRMPTCPNCSAAVLPSARFCVTCGIRLPETTAGAGNAEPAARSGWSQPGEDVWIGEAPALDDESEQQLSDDQPTNQSQTGGPQDQSQAANSDASEAAAEPDQSDTQAIADTEEVIAIPPTDEREQPLDAADDAEIDPDEQTIEASFQPAATESDNEVSPAADEPNSMPVHSDTGAEHSDVSGSELFEAVNELVGPEGELAAASTDSAYASDPLENESGDSFDTDEFAPAGWNGDDEDALTDARAPLGGIEETDQMSAFTSPAGAAIEQEDDRTASLARAASLLDELRDLLPNLATPPAPTAPAVDLMTLRDQAIAGRGEHSFDNFSALREVTGDAVNRPRDIEVMLRLSQRIDDIDALLKEYDRLNSAFDTLIEQLNQ